MTLMVFAAGEGTRFRPQTEILPKPAIPFLRVPLALWGLQHFQNLSLDRIVVNTFHLPQKVVETFQHPALNDYEIKFSHETGLILGSGGGLFKARNLLPERESFFVINGDEFFVPEDPNFLQKVWQYHMLEKNLITMVTTDHPEVGKKFGGVWVDKEHNVLGFGKTPAAGSLWGEHNIGLMVIHPDFFKYFSKEEPSNILYDHAVKAIAAKEKVKTYPQKMHWFETGNKTDFIEAHEWCINEIKQGSALGNRMLQVMRKFDLEFDVFNLEHGVLIADNNFDRKSVIVDDFAVLGKRVKMVQGCQIKKTIVGNGLLVDQNISDEVKLA